MAWLTWTGRVDHAIKLGRLRHERALATLRHLSLAPAVKHIIANAAVQPLDRYFKFAAGSVGRELKVNRTAKFMRDKFANDACSITRFARSIDDRPAGLLPFDDQPIVCFAVR